MYGNSPSDFGFLPPQFKSDVQVFTGNYNDASYLDLQTWIKPKGATMIHFLLIGSGGGGAGGQSSASNKGGGGGGGSGAITSVVVPAIFVPNILRILVAKGGRGGAAGQSGEAGNETSIFLGRGLSSIVRPNIFLRCAGGPGSTSGNPGFNGGTATNFTLADIGGTVALLGIFSNTGIATNIGHNGVPGSNGGSSTTFNASNLTGVWNVISISGGTGGAGASSTTAGIGGTITLQAAVNFEGGGFYYPSNIISGGASGGGNGNAGVRSLTPFFNTGGTGGGSSVAGTGGNGGDGGYGCGGGGGGGGATGGRGGNGGDGIAIITSW